MKKISIAISSLFLLIAAGAYYYIALPAINLHSPGMWGFIIVLLMVIGFFIVNKAPYKPVKNGVIGIIVVTALVFAIGWLLSSQIINAKKYSQLINISERNFSEDIK